MGLWDKFNFLLSNLTFSNAFWLVVLIVLWCFEDRMRQGIYAFIDQRWGGILPLFRRLLGFLPKTAWVLILLIVGLSLVRPTNNSSAKPSAVERKSESEALFPMRLRTLLFVNSVEYDEASHKYALKGIFNRFDPVAFPRKLSFHVYSEMRFEVPPEPNLRAQYIITDSEGNDIAVSKWINLSMGVGYPGAVYIHHFKEVLFRQPGNYIVHLELKKGRDVAIVGKETLIVRRKQFIGPKKESLVIPPVPGKEGSQTQ